MQQYIDYGFGAAAGLVVLSMVPWRKLVDKIKKKTEPDPQERELDMQQQALRDYHGLEVYQEYTGCQKQRELLDQLAACLIKGPK